MASKLASVGSVIDVGMPAALKTLRASKAHTLPGGRAEEAGSARSRVPTRLLEAAVLMKMGEEAAAAVPAACACTGAFAMAALCAIPPAVKDIVYAPESEAHVPIVAAPV